MGYVAGQSDNITRGFTKVCRCAVPHWRAFFILPGDSMKITFGKHRGKAAELVFFNDPSYVMWVLRTDAVDEAICRLRSRFELLVVLFDQKEYISECWGCGKTAERMSFYCHPRANNSYLTIMPWCSRCDISSAGASPHKVTAIKSYCDIVDYVNSFCINCNGYPTRGAYKDYVRRMAQHKGLPRRVGEKQATKFFNLTQEAK